MLRQCLKSFALLASMLMLYQAACAETVKLPLQKLTAVSTLEMHCINGGANLSIPIPERWKVDKAVLRLHYTISNNMLSDLSQMVLRVNGEMLTQLKLDGQAPGVAHEVEIPVRLLKPGYNTLTFQVAQHYSRQQCEQPCAPDLWTNISLTDSSLQLDYEMQPIPLRLGEAANWVFDPKQFPEATVNLVADTSTAEATTMLGIAASGIARQFDYRKVKFTHSLDIKPDVDNVLIGTSALVSGVLTKYGIRQDAYTGGLIRVLYLPKSDGGKDGLHALFVVAGEKPISLKIAAETFANMSMSYPGTDEMHAYEFSMPDISMYSGRRELAPDKVYDFKTLGLAGATFEGFNGKPGSKDFNGNASELNFRLPSDFMIKQNESAKLVLNFSYGSGLRQDSSLSVALNGETVRDIHLDSPNGNYIDGYKLDLPTYLFKPGNNIISFKPYLNTARQVCDADNTEGLFVTIFGNSTLFFPPMPHFVTLPRLDLFALNGFPFTRWPDGFETLVYLPQHDDGSIDTALNLIGMITQRNGFPLFGTQFAYAEPKDWQGEMLVVGEAAAIPKFLMEHAPFQPNGIANVPYPISRGWDSETSIALSKQQGGMGEEAGLLMEFESPNKTGRSVILATAQTENSLRLLGDALLSPGIQNSVTGDVALIQLNGAKNALSKANAGYVAYDLNEADYGVTSLSVGKIYTTGNKGDASWVDAILYGNSYVLYGLIAFTMVMLSMAGYWLLRKYRAKRTKNEQG